MPSPKHIIKILFHKLSSIFSQVKINISIKDINKNHKIVNIIGQKYGNFVYEFFDYQLNNYLQLYFYYINLVFLKKWIEYL